jgi:poly-gamma-glutamate synthesis protein (capsule biosynthesis protein)
MGHGPHFPLAVEIHNGKPIFYGLGSFSFETGHRAQRHPDWIGLVARLGVEDGKLARTAFSFVRHNAGNETIPRPVAGEQDALASLREMSARFGASLEVEDDEIVVRPKG